MKSHIVVISSSDEDGGYHEGNSDEEEVQELESSESDDDDYDSDYDDDDEGEENDVESNEEENVDSNCNHERLVHHHHQQGSNDLLSVSECKEYLRKHGLRLSGTKEECLQRIKEHKRLKDGRGESLYPRSLFSINCTGDACKGDVVLFRQKVYKKRANIVGKRTVAGRIVKESYGASKQQHTFTIEVLWSKPSRNLPPLSTLLVKGRNLYKFGTFRQPWKNEAERSKVLGEKHTRGEAARHKRKLRKTDILFNKDKGKKRQKLSHGGPSQNKHLSRIDKHKSYKHKSVNNRRGAAPVNKNIAAHKKTARFQKMDSERPVQPTFHSHPNRSIYSDHRLQEASSSSFSYDTTALPNLHPFGNSGHRFNNSGQPRSNYVLNQPPSYYHYNYEQDVPRYRLG